MSHYCVLVASEKREDVEKLLAPYQENNMGDCPNEYLAFNDKEDEYLNEYNTELMPRVKYPNGEHYSKYDKRFEVEIYEDDRFPTTTFVVPDGCVEVEIPFKDIFSTLEDYVKYWHGVDRDPKTNRYGWWENPNAKWDWYSEGGRYSKAMRNKAGNYITSGKVKEIDFGINKEDYDWSIKFWELYIEGQTPQNEEEEKMIKYCFYNKEYFIKRFETKEMYAEASSCFSTYAFVGLDGQWFSKGEMGWFGLSNEDASKVKDFSLSFYDRFIKDLPEDTILTVIDCHI